MYRFAIISQHTQYAKNILGYFIRTNRKGCRVELYEYNKMFCDVVIRMHPNYKYSVVLNYIDANKNQLICSRKALEWFNSTRF